LFSYLIAYGQNLLIRKNKRRQNLRSPLLLAGSVSNANSSSKKGMIVGIVEKLKKSTGKWFLLKKMFYKSKMKNGFKSKFCLQKKKKRNLA